MDNKEKSLVQKQIDKIRNAEVEDLIDDPLFFEELFSFLRSYDKSLTRLRDVKKLQCLDGNCNYSPYMHGMANGIILALSLFEGGEPEYLKAPKKWLEESKETVIFPEESKSNG